MSGDSTHRAEDSDSPPSPSPSPSQPSSPSSPSSSSPAAQGILSYFATNKTEALLMMTRISTLVFSFLYLIPFIGSISCFRKALIGNAATSALRLHQRLPSFRFSREYMSQLITEDSCHYLLFSMIFLYSNPITLVLLPLALFAFLHLSSSALLLMDKTGTRRSWLGTTLSNLINKHQQSILVTVSMAEIMMMPIIVMAVFGGVASLITPFIYYRFLSLRYSSRRNPYTRQTFRRLRLTTESLIFLPGCPQFVRNIVLRLVEITCKLAPPLPGVN